MVHREDDPFVDELSVQEGMTSNLIAYPGFEPGVAGWSTGGAAITGSTLREHTGAQSGIVTNRTATWQGAAYDLTKQLASGKTYDARIRATVGPRSRPATT